MSIESWKKEFYTRDILKMSAEEVRKMSAETAVKHSLRKWRGLTAENLEKHNLYKNDCSTKIFGDGTFYVDADTCALCAKYITNCRQCPLYKSLGRRCDAIYDAPYNLFMDWGKAEPMIKALENTLVQIQENKKKKNA